MTATNRNNQLLSHPLSLSTTTTNGIFNKDSKQVDKTSIPTKVVIEHQPREEENDLENLDFKHIESDLSMVYSSINQSKTSVDPHYLNQPNSFYQYQSMLSFHKSQIKPELYQLAFDVQMENDGEDQDQDLKNDKSTVFIGDEPTYQDHKSPSRTIYTIKPKSTIVTHDPKNGQNIVINQTGVWMKSGAKATMAHLYPSSSLLMSKTNGAPVCCCCVM